jgi:type VI secretion system secreted protein Hcp
MAVDMFLKITGVEGESADSKHGKEIDVLSWSWGMTQSGTAHLGGGAGSGKVHVNDLTFTKYIDSSSNMLIKSCCNGKHFPDALLTIRKAGEKPLEYLKIKLHDILITAVSTGGSGGEDRLTENVTLNFAKFAFAYQPQNKAGGPEGGAKEATWNIAANSE